MNASISSLAGSVFNWLADYYLAATLLLILALVARRWVRQPAHRIVIAWALMFELVALAIVCMLPFWPRMSFYVAAPPAPAVAVVEPAPIVERQHSLPMNSIGLMPLPHNVADPIGDASVPAENSATEAADPPVAEQPPVASPAQPGLAWQQQAAVGFIAGAAAVVFWLGWGAAATGWLCWQAEPAGNSLTTQLLLIIGSDRRSPRLLVSRRIATAVALGVLRPTIVLPQKLARSSPPHTLRAVLLHEWAHIRHRDLWLLAVGRCLLAVLFAHPLFWWLRRTIRVDQELLADAAAAGEQRHDYAQELVRLVRITGNAAPRPISAGVGIWEGSSSFSRRIATLLDETFRISLKGSRRWRIKALAAMAIVGLICSLATLQPAKSTAESGGDNDKIERVEKSDPAVSLAETTGGEEETVHVAGTCVDSAKRPIAGAEVYLYEETPWPGPSFVGKAKTDAHGKFTFPNLLPMDPASEAEDIRHFFIAARASGKARAYDCFVLPNVREDVGRLELTMHDAITIAGRVTDTNGKPISGVRMLDYPFTSLADATCLATTNADGLYKTTEALKTVYDNRPTMLQAFQPGFNNNSKDYKGNPGAIDFVLERLRTSVEGRVVDAVTGRPAVRALVDARDPSNSGGSTVTDSEGRYRLWLNPGTYDLSARQNNRTCRAVESFEIKFGEKRTSPDLRLIEGGVIEARVTDADTRQPINGVGGNPVCIRVYHQSNSDNAREYFHESRSLRCRSYVPTRLRVAPGMNYVELLEAPSKSSQHSWEVVKDSSFDANGRKPVEVVEGKTAQVEFKVRLSKVKAPQPTAKTSPKKSVEKGHAVHVAGTCVDATNRPIAGAEVCLYERKGAASFVLLEQRQTDAAGKFAFSALHLRVPKSDDDVQSFFVQARAKGKARDGEGVSSAMIREDVWRRKLILHDAMTITGRVTDTNGKPVAGATISRIYGPLTGSTDPNCLATTDADGFYRVTEAPQIGPKFRRGLLHVRHPEFLIDAVEYKENRDKIDFVLTPASIIEGKVIDAVTGKPAANVYATASVIRPDGYKSPSPGLTNPDARAAITDAEGRYRLPVVAGKHNIRALQKGRVARAIEAFEVKPGERRTAPDLRLIEGAFIEASVVDAETGQPPTYPHGDVCVSRPLGAGTERSRSHTFQYRQDGVVRVRVVPGTNYVALERLAGPDKDLNEFEVVKDSSFDRMARKAVEVVEGQTAKVEFKVKRILAKKAENAKREISGRVFYHDGTPAARAAVFVLSGPIPIIGDGKAMKHSAKRDDANRKITMEKIEDESVIKAIADAEGRFRLPAGSGHAIGVAVSAPRYDLHIMQISDEVVAKESELTIKLPEAGRLVVKHDVPGGQPQAKLFLKRADPQNDPGWPLSMMNGPDNSREPLVANKGQVVFDNLPPGKYVLARQKPVYCDLHTVVVEGGKTVTDGFVHDRGAPVEGRVVGLKPGMFAEAGGSRVGATISVRPEDASDDLVSAAFSTILAKPGRYPRVFDSLTCGADGRFKTEQLLPGKYAIIAECSVPPDPEYKPDGPMGHIMFPAFLGRTVVTVPETGQAPPVTIELKPYKSALQSAAATKPRETRIEMKPGEVKRLPLTRP
jgi:protocatechuate 3,4-dioxygenase beta subunit/Zn-dependent protease with chaperone function